MYKFPILTNIILYIRHQQSLNQRNNFKVVLAIVISSIIILVNITVNFKRNKIYNGHCFPFCVFLHVLINIKHHKNVPNNDDAFKERF